MTAEEERRARRAFAEAYLAFMLMLLASVGLLKLLNWLLLSS